MLNQDDLVLHNVLLQRLFLIKFIHILIEKQTQVMMETKGRVRSNIKTKTQQSHTRTPSGTWTRAPKLANNWWLTLQNELQMTGIKKKSELNTSLQVILVPTRTSGTTRRVDRAPWKSSPRTIWL
jgi:hypothetical protein